MVTMPALEGVEHRYVELGDGVTIHVANAGPADGPAVMLVHDPKDGTRVDVPVRWLCGTKDPVLTPDLLDGYADRISDFEVELVDGVGHWIVEQRPELVLDRLRLFLKAET